MSKRKQHRSFDEAFNFIQKCINVNMLYAGEIEQLKYIFKMYGVDYSDEVVEEIKKKYEYLVTVK